MNLLQDNVLTFSALLFSVISLALLAHNNWQPAYEVDSSAYLSTVHETLPHITLGYAWLVSFVMLLCNNVVSIVLFQIMVSLFCLCSIYRTTLLCFNLRVAQVASVLFAVNIGFLVYAQYVLTEIVLAFLLLLFFERMICFLLNHSYRSLIVSGLLLGVSMIIKPAALFLPIVLSPLFLMYKNNMKYTTMILFLLCLSLPVIGYMGHNYVRFNSFSFSSLAQDNLYHYFLPQLRSYVNPATYDDERSYCMSLSKLQVRSLFITTICLYPWQAIYIWTRNMGKTLLGLYTTQLKVFFDRSINGRQCSFFAQKGSFSERIVSYIQCGTNAKILHYICYSEAIYSVFRLIIILGALGVLWYRRRWLLLYFYLIIPLYFIAITGHDGCGRFRLMIEGLLIVLTAYGLVLLCDWARYYLRRRTCM